MKKNILFLYTFIVSCFLHTSCNKEDKFLSAKPNIALLVPSKLEDYQLLLYRETLFNQANTPGLGTVTTDEYYVTPQWWASCPIFERNAYVFGKGYIYETTLNINDWNLPYQHIYYTNTVLESIEKLDIQPNEQAQFNQVKGQALFFRALAFYNLVQTFALPYDSATAAQNPGVPLKLTSDLNINAPRSSIQQSYDQILTDLTAAVSLLPTTTQFPTQPSKVAANALLARIYLSIRNYTKALQYADATLALKSNLTDYNTLAPTNTYLSVNYLEEDIFQSHMITRSMSGFAGGTMMDSILYSLYDNPNDLRKSVCYRINSGRIEWRGTYAKASASKYSGLATNEMYLIRAECRARAGNTSGAMSDLNTLLRTRWKKNGTISTYVDQSVSTSLDALQLILKERRKELVFRGLRWTDIRRLNQEAGFQTTLTRIFQGVTYTLPPGDPRFAMPIPEQEIQLTGIVQNQR